MLDNVHHRVESLARMAVLTDAGDLPGLVALQEQAVSLAGELDSSQSADLAELARRIGSLAEAIVMRTASDVDSAFGEIGKVIDRLQSAATHQDAGGGPGATTPEEDRELIGGWITSCDGMLTDLEGLLLALERAPTDKDLIGDIRRIMHTLKGECGVLSLHEPQKLCHEAESLIDTRLAAGQAVPIDPYLLLLDWMKSFTARLAADHSARPDSGAAVMDALVAARSTPNTEAASNAAASAPEPVAVSAAVTAPAPVAVAASVVVDTTPVTLTPLSGTEDNVADFLCEAKDHLANSEEALLSLEQDRANKELINTVFRAFHTIKGVAGFMALQPIVSLAHSAEQLLDGARSGTISLDRRELDVILASCDLMTKLLGVLEGSKGPSQSDLRALIQRLDEAAIPGGAKAPQRHTPTASAAPTGVAAAPGAIAPEATKTPVAPAAKPQQADTTLEAKSGTRAGAPPAEADAARQARKGDQTVKISTMRMDSLVTMVGELVIAQQMVAQDVAAMGSGGQRVQRALSHMSKMIRELQEVSMSLRMVNLKGTFQKMTRLVRDVSQKAGKQIEVVTDGEDVELDRNVVEVITDPLVHMIRNACDHGVEPPDERRAAGKAPTGTLTLRAYHAGGSIVIEIADDGRGLRREKLLAKARSKGLLPPDVDEASMSDSEVFGLIFLPGFSTAEKVTDISGRGVGMDVVRRNIESLRGKVDIRSVPGQGTTFLMRLPLTMAIIDGMVVRVGKQRYVLPTLSIQQSFRPHSQDVKTVVGAGEMINVRGSMLPIYRLNRVLGLDEGFDEITDGLLIVTEANDTRFCLMVDEILGQHSVVIKTLTQTGQQLSGVSGGAILGDGRVALILDVSQVVGLAREGIALSGTRRAAHEVRVAGGVSSQGA